MKKRLFKSLLGPSLSVSLVTKGIKGLNSREEKRLQLEDAAALRDEAAKQPVTVATVVRNAHLIGG